MGEKQAKVSEELVIRLRMLEVGKYYSTKQIADKWGLSKVSARAFLRYWEKRGIFFSSIRGWWKIGLLGEVILQEVSKWPGIE